MGLERHGLGAAWAETVVGSLAGPGSMLGLINRS